MTPEEKLAAVEKQIEDVQRGIATKIDCPYCGDDLRPSDTELCCDLLRRAIDAILDRQATLIRLSVASEILDKSKYTVN